MAPTATNETPRLSVVVVSFNTCEVLAECLDSVFRDLPDFGVEVIVVDNASSDGSAAMVAQRFPTARLVRNPRNRMFSAANNQGLRLARGDYVVILNSDTVVSREFLETLAWHLDENPDVAAVVGSRADEDGTRWTTFWPQHSFDDLLRILFPVIWLKPPVGKQMPRVDELPLRAVEEVEIVSDGCVMVRLSALRELGYYDERLRLYYTEDDLSIRLRRAGWRLASLRDAVFFHHGARSTRKHPLTAAAVMSADRMRFVAKHMGLTRAALLAPVAAFDLLWRWHLVLRHRLRVSLRGEG